MNYFRNGVQHSGHIYWQEILLLHFHRGVFNWINPVVRETASAENRSTQRSSVDRAIKPTRIWISIDPQYTLAVPWRMFRPQTCRNWKNTLFHIKLFSRSLRHAHSFQNEEKWEIFDVKMLWILFWCKWIFTSKIGFTFCHILKNLFTLTLIVLQPDSFK